MEKIRNYVKELFEEAPKTSKVRELREEIIYNLEDKFEDLIKEGKSEKEAYKEVFSSIGNIEELIKDIEEDPIQIKQLQDNRKETAFIVSIAIGIYFVSLILCLICEELKFPTIYSGVAFLFTAGIATCLLIYHFMSQAKYEKIDNTIVEEFKEWKASKTQNYNIKRTVNSTIWLMIVVIYFLFNFRFGHWHISWIIFLIGIVIINIVNLLFFWSNK